MHVQLDDFQLRYEYPVQWGDMDAAQHVNNLVYLRWSESARIEFFQKLLDEHFDFNNGTGPILAWQDCKYIFPLTFPDTAIVGVRLLDSSADRFMMETAIFSKNNNRIAALAKQLIMAYDYGQLKKVELPAYWLKQLRPYFPQGNPLDNDD